MSDPTVKDLLIALQNELAALRKKVDGAASMLAMNQALLAMEKMIADLDIRIAELTSKVNTVVLEIEDFKELLHIDDE